MKNQILALQNESPYVDCLVAQERLYGRSKRWLGGQLWLALIGIAGSVTAYLYADLKFAVGLYGLLVLLLEALWLNPRHKQWREAGAHALEEFDNRLLGMDWNVHRAPRPKTLSELLNERGRHTAKTLNRNLLNWYHPWWPDARFKLSDLPLPLARLVCQRQNVWWDSRQREEYAEWLRWILFGSLVLAIVLALLYVRQHGGTPAQAVESALVVFVLPLAGFFKLMYQMYTEQRDAIVQINKLRDTGADIWKAALADPESPELLRLSRALQDEIYEGRRRRPVVFDFIYKRLRPRQELDNQHNTERLVEEALAALSAKPSPPLQAHAPTA
ncbi:S-4TM family putative pore-forming effector [Sphaerotilus microaerophilus]|uniref:DUF4231 domain-containing protein n=1 Tax=Sphaerotilus microaerophilus TaxID=2914710 RepID=A0ABM7YMP4_9BURK|nr:S-4TM family putative pore-forming effector [Sphaerotilus sp. FB-5]BDI05749.1 hypothetical protein CATMQ487_27190 [Sphaerotilus sp. FB-5]